VSTGPNSQDQLDIIQQINKALQDQNKILSQLSNVMGAQAQAGQQAAAANERVADTAANATQKSQELTEALKENTGGAEGLGAAMGKSAEQTKSASDATNKMSQAAGASVAILGALSAAMSGVREATAAAKGVFNLFTDGISAGMGIFKGALGVIGGFFSGLMGAAAAYHNAAAGEMHQANESLRKEFGDITSDQGKFIKGLASDLGTAQKALGAAGTSLWGTIGRSAAVLQEMTAIAGEFGDSLVRMQDQIGGAVSQLVLMRKGMNISGEAFKNIASNVTAAGGSMEDALNETMVASSYLSKKFGVDVKVIGKNIDKMAKDMGTFGHLGPKSLAAVATYATKLGVSIESLKGTMDAFDTFESAAQNAGKLAEAFGMNVDVMGMMNAENPAERMDMLRKSFEETGRSVSDLSRHELKMLSESMGGMPVDELKNALSMSTDEMGFGDFEDAAEEAAQKITPEEAMQDVAKSVDRLATKLDKLAGGPLANFINGFMKVIDRSPEMRELLSLVGKWLKEFHKAGQAVAHMFLDFIRGDGAGAFQMIKDIFDIKRIQKFLGTVKEAFGEFFRLVKTDPKQAVENLFDKVFGAFEEWFGSGPSGNNLATMLGGLIETGFKILAGLAPKIIKTAAKYIQMFADSLRDFLNGDNKTANSIGDGIGGAFMLAFTSIKDAIINDLAPALLDLFGVLFAKIGPPLIAILSAVWTVIFIKSIVSATLAAAAGAAVKVGIEVLALKLAGMGSKAAAAQGAPGDAEKAAGSTKSMAEGMEDMLKAFRKITKKDVKHAGMLMWEMTKHMIKGMVGLAAGMVAVSLVLSVVPFMALIKGIVGLTTATMNTVLLIGAVFAYDKVSKSMGGPKNVNKGLFGLAGILALGGIAMALASVVFGAAWSLVPIGPLLMGVALMNALILGSLPMLVIAGVLGFFIDKLMTPILTGIGGLAIVIAVASLLAFPAMLFGKTWGGVDALGVLKGVFLLNMMIVGIIPFLVVGAILGAMFMTPVGAFAAAGMAGLAVFLGVLMLAAPVIGDGANRIAKEIGSKVDAGAFAKAMGILSSMALVTPLIVAAGAIMFALGPGLVLALIGLNNMQVFLKGASFLIVEAIEALANIKISDPKKTSATLDIVGKVVKAVALLADVGMKALKISMAASLPFFGSGDPASMMKTMSTFINDILGTDGAEGGGIVGAVDKMVKMAGKFDKNSLKGAEAIAGMVAAIGQLAGALIEPLTSMSENAGNWYGGGKGDDMQKMVKAVGDNVGTILDGMKEGLIGTDKKPGMIVALLNIFKHPTLANEKPDVLKQRAETLKALFGAVLSLVTSMEKINDFAVPAKKGFMGFGAKAGKKASDVLDGLFKDVSYILELESLKGVVKSAIKLTEMLGTAEEAEKIKKGGEGLSAVVSGIVSVIQGLSGLGTFLVRKEGAQGLLDLKTAFTWMEEGEYLPSMIVGKITTEALAIASNMKKMEAKFGKVQLKPQLEAIMGYSGEHKITIAPEAVNLTVKLQVAIDAEDLAVAIAKSNATKYDGFFKTTEKVGASALDLTAD